MYEIRTCHKNAARAARESSLATKTYVFWHPILLHTYAPINCKPPPPPPGRQWGISPLRFAWGWGIWPQGGLRGWGTLTDASLHCDLRVYRVGLFDHIVCPRVGIYDTFDPTLVKSPPSPGGGGGTLGHDRCKMSNWKVWHMNLCTLAHYVLGLKKKMNEQLAFFVVVVVLLQNAFISYKNLTRKLDIFRLWKAMTNHQNKRSKPTYAVCTNEHDKQVRQILWRHSKPFQFFFFIPQAIMNFQEQPSLCTCIALNGKQRQATSFCDTFDQIFFWTLLSNLHPHVVSSFVVVYHCCKEVQHNQNYDIDMDLTVKLAYSSLFGNEDLDTHTRARAHTHTHSRARPRARVHTHTHRRTHTHTHTHTHAHTRAHTHTQTHTHTHLGD